jgi:hypothetical protein
MLKNETFVFQILSKKKITICPSVMQQIKLYAENIKHIMLECWRKNEKEIKAHI